MKRLWIGNFENFQLNFELSHSTSFYYNALSCNVAEMETKRLLAQLIFVKCLPKVCSSILWTLVRGIKYQHLRTVVALNVSGRVLDTFLCNFNTTTKVQIRNEWKNQNTTAGLKFRHQYRLKFISFHNAIF